jgi:hypothetical protein|tara:strand:+ start:3104 stop:3784 length:681 start_codon:yes stop_codon:yes gene_type:complete
MIVGISQPTFFPWIGYYNIIKTSKVFVFLDNVKFEKHSWQMRNRIKNSSKHNDSEVWMSVPTKAVTTRTLIKDVIIDNSKDWKQKHVKTLKNNYSKNFQQIKFLTEIYDREWNNLVDFNIESITKCCEYLGIKTKLIRASNLLALGKKGDLVLNICKELNAKEYLSTIGSKDYLEDYRDSFEDAGIKIIYHDYTHPIYKQKGNSFLPNLSILDLILSELDNAYKFI